MKFSSVSFALSIDFSSERNVLNVLHFHSCGIQTDSAVLNDALAYFSRNTLENDRCIFIVLSRDSDAIGTNPRRLRVIHFSKFSSRLFDFFSRKLADLPKPPSRNDHRFKGLIQGRNTRAKCRLIPDQETMHAIRVVVKSRVYFCEHFSLHNFTRKSQGERVFKETAYNLSLVFEQFGARFCEHFSGHNFTRLTPKG